MASAGDSPSIPISAIPAEGVPPPPVSTPRTSIPATPLTPASRVVQPPASTNVASTSSGVVTGIPSVPSASPSFGVPVSRVMASSREGISTPTLAVLARGVPPPLVGNHRTNIPTTPLTPGSRVVQPPTSTNVVRTSVGVVTRILSAPSASPSFAYTAQSGPVGSSSFV